MVTRLRQFVLKTPAQTELVRCDGRGLFGPFQARIVPVEVGFDYPTVHTVVLKRSYG